MAQPHAKPGEIVSLRQFDAAFCSQKTTAVVKCEEFEAIRLVVPAGSTIPSHKVAGPLTLHCLEGTIALDLDGASLEMEAGDWVYLVSNEAHSLRGLRDASLLLTIVFPR